MMEETRLTSLAMNAGYLPPKAFDAVDGERFDFECGGGGF